MRIVFNPIAAKFDYILAPAEILAGLLTVDGAGSLLDADLLDGQHAAAFQPVDATLTTLSALADGAGVLTNNGAGVLSWAAVGAGDLYEGGTGGIVGQVAEWVTDDKHLQAANIIAPANLLTLVAGAPYSLTIPATGTTALLGTANVFTTQQMVDGTSDQIQLRVQGNAAQTARLQTWEKSDGTVLAALHSAGQLSIGINATSFSSAETVFYQYGSKFIDSADACGMVGYIEIRASNNTSKSGYGIRNVTNAIVTSGKTISGSVVAGDYFSQNNQAGGIVTNQVAGRFTVSAYAGVITNAYGALIKSATVSGGTGTITNNYGLYIENQTLGGTLNYAIYTGTGDVRFGDEVVIASPTANALTIGAGTAGIDYTITVNGETNDCVHTWYEDEAVYGISSEMSVKLFSQDAEPTLGMDTAFAFWKDTNDSNRIYFLFRRGAGDHVKIELV